MPLPGWKLSVLRPSKFRVYVSPLSLVGASSVITSKNPRNARTSGMVSGQTYLLASFFLKEIIINLKKEGGLHLAHTHMLVRTFWLHNNAFLLAISLDDLPHPVKVYTEGSIKGFIYLYYSIGIFQPLLLLSGSNIQDPCMILERTHALPSGSHPFKSPIALWMPVL